MLAFYSEYFSLIQKSERIGNVCDMGKHYRPSASSPMTWSVMLNECRFEYYTCVCHTVGFIRDISRSDTHCLQLAVQLAAFCHLHSESISLQQ